MAEPLVHRFLYRLVHRHIEKHRTNSNNTSRVPIINVLLRLLCIQLYIGHPHPTHTALQANTYPP